MKEIMQEYASAVITVLIALILFALIYGKISVDGNTGFIEILSSKSELSQQDYLQYADAKESIKAMERKRPVITCENISIQANSKWKAKDLFAAEDIDGNDAEVEILKAEFSDGSEVSVAGNEIQFLQQGIYQIWVKATDVYCGVTKDVFLIPVIAR